jgi:hypothetical protein
MGGETEEDGIARLDRELRRVPVLMGGVKMVARVSEVEVRDERVFEQMDATVPSAN